MTSNPESMIRTACGMIVLGLLPVGPATAQEVIEVRGEDRRLEAGFEELYRIGSLDGYFPIRLTACRLALIQHRCLQRRHDG